ncbi:MAG: uroporphyrinogen-III synthase [Pseudomonadales bacterium]|nr:uroporphyrinogen-III synthase [Pseudomonadales bacterium]
MSQPLPLIAKVLVTRPEHRQAALCELLQSKSLQPVSFATIKIAARDSSHTDYGRLKQHILDLDLFDIIICVSANAAAIAGELIEDYWPQLPLGITWIAIGNASARALAKYQIQALTPAADHDSEALLQLVQLQQLAGKKVLILKGNSGRQLLSETLCDRGAIITEAVLYDRLIATYTDQQINNSLYNSGLSAILVTSGEALCNLTAIASGSQKQFEHKSLLATPLIVPSTRVAKIASTQGYYRITVARAADNQAMLDALLTVKGLEADNEETQ